MKEQLISRGPDAEGSWCNDSQDVTLGHRRLSILDLSPGGAQPMVSHSGRFVISYNGEIYNCREVEKKLRREGLLGALHGSSDTEILLEALEAYGVKEGICARVCLPSHFMTGKKNSSGFCGTELGKNRCITGW